MPFVPSLGRQRQADLCEFEASLVYKASSRTGPKAIEKPRLEKNKTSKQTKVINTAEDWKVTFCLFEIM